MKLIRLLTTVLLLTTPSLIMAQGFTDADWSAADAGVNQNVHALAADGYRGYIYAGGEFTVAGAPANYLASWDGDGWVPFDTELNGTVRALVVSGGDLYAGGVFTTAGGATVNGVAKWSWDTEEWSALGSGVNGTVSALVVNGGDIVAAGTFTTAGGVPANHIAKWNGTAWSSLGSGCDSAVTALAVKNGELYAGGAFTTAGGGPASRIAKWNGSAWSALGAGISGGNVTALAVKQGVLFAGGDFPGGVAQWNGSAWSVPGAGVGGGSVAALIVQGGNLYAGGSFLTAGGAAANRMAKWDGSAWSPLGSGVNDAVFALTKDTSGHLYAGGAFTTAGTTPAAHVAMADVGRPPAPEVTAISPSSGLYTGGTVVTITGSNLSLVEQVWFGEAEAASFTIISDTQIIATTAPVSDTGAEEGVYVTSDGGASDSGAHFFQFWGRPLVQAGTGKLLPAATSFIIQGERFSTVAGENTVTFSPAGTGTVVPGNNSYNLTVTNVTGLTPGPLYAVITTRGLSSGAQVQVATVAAATPGDVAAPDFGLNGSVTSIATQPDGKIIMAGAFTEAGGTPRNGLARFYPSGELDGGFDPNPVIGAVSCVAVQHDGFILVSGTFTGLQPRKQGAVITRNRIARLTEFGFVDPDFDPNANGTVSGFVEQEDRWVLLFGAFTTLQPNGAAAATTRKYIARVDYLGRLDENFDPGANNIVRCALPLPDGRVVFGGLFTAVQPNGGASVTRNRLARVNANGTLDTGFDPNVQTAGSVIALAMQPDGRLLVGGEFTALQPNGAGTATARKGLARLNADGTLDAGFNPNADRNFVTCIALQADGRIIVGGRFTTLQPNGAAAAIARNRVARLNTDGTVDTAFDPGAGDAVYTAVLEADGRVLIGGEFSFLKPNGASDQTSTRRQGLARLVNDPATQTISITASATVLWQRGGSAPEVSVVEIDRALSPSSGWGNPLRATRAGTSANWELAGLPLGTSGILRARGRLTSGGQFGGNVFMEQLFTYPPVVNVTAAVAGYAASFGLTGANAAPGAQPFGDGVPNLLKYAFNIPLTGPNVTQLTPGTGTGGLPVFSAPPAAPGTPPVIRLEFVRRRNSTLIYTPKRATILGTFTPLTVAPAVTVIDANWERVVYEEPPGTPAPPTLFCIVTVAAP